MPVRRQLRRGPLEHHLSAVGAGPRPQIDHVVGGPDGLLVVLDDHHGVAEVAQPPQRRQQQPVVPLVQADGGLVEHVQHAGEVGADLGGEPYALPLSPRQGGRAPRQRQVADADLGEEPQPVADLAEHAAGNQLLALRQLDGGQRRVRLRQRQPGVLGDGAALHPHRSALGPQALAIAGGAALQGTERLEQLLLGPGPRLVAAAQVRQDPLEVAPERLAATAAAPVSTLLGLRRGGAGAVQQGVAVPADSRSNGVSRSMPKCRLSPRRPLGPASRRRRPTARSRPPSTTSSRPARCGRGRSRRRRRGPGSPCRRPAAS